MTQAELLHELTTQLQIAGIPNASFDAKQLLMSILDLDLSALLLHMQDDLDFQTVSSVRALLARRIDGEPLQYLLGSWSFLDETFYVGRGVLIPRPETEELVLLCETLLQGMEAPVIYDLCAGTGCIGLSLQKRVPDAYVFLIESSGQALSYLRRNADKLADSNRTSVIRGDVLGGFGSFSGLPKADLIVSNPPYIPTDALTDLQREVQKEPHMALDGGEDGLNFYRCFADLWTDALKPYGAFAFECGEGQGKQICDLFRRKGFTTEINLDFNGFDRFVVAARGRKDLI